jgi:hypothetical protein
MVVHGTGEAARKAGSKGGGSKDRRQQGQEVARTGGSKEAGSKGGGSKEAGSKGGGSKEKGSTGGKAAQHSKVRDRQQVKCNGLIR